MLRQVILQHIIIKMIYPNYLSQAYLEMPPVTRVYTTACVITTLAVQLEIVSPFQLYFNPLLILRLNLTYSKHMGLLNLLQAISSLEIGHNISVFWHFWVQLSVQHDLHLPILQNVGGGKFQGQICWFCYDVCVWSTFYDNLCLFCESPLPWSGGYLDFERATTNCILSGIHHHACVCLGQEKSLHQDELLWSPHIQCSLLTLGLAWIFLTLGKFCVGWSSWWVFL